MLIQEDERGALPAHGPRIVRLIKAVQFVSEGIAAETLRLSSKSTTPSATTLTPGSLVRIADHDIQFA